MKGDRALFSLTTKLPSVHHPFWSSHRMFQPKAPTLDFLLVWRGGVMLWACFPSPKDAELRVASSREEGVGMGWVLLGNCALLWQHQEDARTCRQRVNQIFFSPFPRILLWSLYYVPIGRWHWVLPPKKWRDTGFSMKPSLEVEASPSSLQATGLPWTKPLSSAHKCGRHLIWAKACFWPSSKPCFKRPTLTEALSLCIPHRG